MVRVALTGGIAEGKSTVLGYLGSMGYKIASADLLACEVYDLEEVQAELAGLSGLPRPVDRLALREAMEGDPGLRRSVNRLMHPRIVERLAASDAEYTEVPLLVEVCLFGAFDEIWVVTCGEDEQLRRLSERFGPDEAPRMLKVQLPTTAKLPFADEVIRTNAPEQHVLNNVRKCADRG
ncbi:MAG: dephospho-CoA kinase [Fimbriimonas ginsengisoli]|uniref:Dephospho-CoA kinase n=1 Tax=Fimbriimonas ginsengisoli TaxID=1005039 RepID=A0A931LVF4_FIMGI|nr:dephospho-CoA kinase [Fimbriimonas ginsengisoli]